MKQLIVNADDFGRSPQVNSAVLHAHREGVLTSASLMVAEPAAAEAALAARDCPQLDVGLHVVACNGRSLLPASKLRGVVDDKGLFPRSDAKAGLRYALHRRLLPKLRDEFRAQIERHLELVGSLNHINGHHNLHLHPDLANILIELASEYDVPCLRLVREPVFTTLALSRDHWPRKLRDHFLFRALSRRARRKMRKRRLVGNDFLFGFHQTGRLTERYVLGVLARLPENSVTEFYFHPSEEVNGAAPMWPSQALETRILTSLAVRGAIEKLGIRLTTYGKIARKAKDQSN
ncbi:MAG: hopanoid biosynthesis-associated protein HpnK [Acidobacteriota bacterium]|nr:hopanoid biosynthesis-associated protein HpnK [Acidobacteriota bacterium]